MKDHNNILIEYKHCNFTPISNKDSVLLHNISLLMKEKEKIAIIGKTGCGKSLLLLSILNELECVNINENENVKFYKSENLSYCSQIPWIPNDTIQNIITFNSNFILNKYNDVIKTCSLSKDIESFPGRDNSEIGYNGINLSGGQRQRLCLARTIYHNAELYLLDDVFASLDSVVSEEIFESLFNKKDGYLKDKSVILVTHDLEFAKRFDRIIVIEEGRIIKDGKSDEIMKELKSKIEEINESNKSVVSGGESSGQLIFDEKSDEGKIKSFVYFYYFKNMGHIILLVVFISLTISQV